MAMHYAHRALSRLFILLALLVAAQGMTAAQDGEPQYVTWTESNNLFAFDIPYGWIVDAYTFDLFGQTAPFFYVFEPEERAVIIAGLPTATLYLDSANYAEGETVTLDGYTFTVGAYQTPADYLENYLRTDILAYVCDTVFIVLIADAEPTDEGSTAAEISLECHYAEGGYANGFFYLQTMQAEIEGVGLMWMPTDFYGYLAEPEVEAQTVAAMQQMEATFTISQQATLQTEAVVNSNAETPVSNTTGSDYDPDAFLAAQQELYQQQQTAAMISNMLQMQHQTSMAIINNIGGSGTTYEYQWVWTP